MGDAWRIKTWRTSTHVLQKLEDQILINGEQFSTLIRMHKHGESITLSTGR